MRRLPAPARSRPAPSGEPPGAAGPSHLPGALAAGLVFAASGSVLVLEILSVRLLAPYVGLTLETTTSIIGAVLAGIAAGAALGGRVADRLNPRVLLVGLFVLGGLLVLLTVPIIRWLGPAASDEGNAAAVGVTFAALVPLAAVLSGVTPTVARLQLRDLRVSGRVVGGLSAWATAGALVGTFGTGFVLVPLLPVSATVLAIGAALVLAGILLGAYMRLLSRSRIALAALLGLGMAGLAVAQHSPCLAESGYHCIELREDPERLSAQYLLLDGGFNSAIDREDPRYLGFAYEKWFAEAIDGLAPHRPLAAVFVGGGAFTMPSWLNATHPGSRSTVLEVDGKLVDFDRERLGLRTSSRLRAIVGDARLTMGRQHTHSADIVVGDAFSSRTVPWQLMTSQWLKEVKRVLKPRGLYMLNMIDLHPLALLRAETATLLGSFAHVRLTTAPSEEGGPPAGGNEVLVASSGALPRAQPKPADGGQIYERPALVRLVAGAGRLRDDYAPVDQLETR